MGPRSAPEGPRSGPGGPKTAQGAARSAPKRPQEPPKFSFRAVLAAKWGSTGAQEPSGGLQEAILDPSRGRFSTLQGTGFALFSTVRQAFPKLSFGQSLRKHTVRIAQRPCVQNCPLGKACASIRSASLDVLV